METRINNCTTYIHCALYERLRCEKMGLRKVFNLLEVREKSGNLELGLSGAYYKKRIPNPYAISYNSKLGLHSGGRLRKLNQNPSLLLGINSYWIIYIR